MTDPPTNLELTGPGGISAKLGGKRVAEIVAILSLVALAVLGYTVYMMHGTLSGVSSAIRDLAQAQRELTCIISRPQDEREKEYLHPNSFCKQMGRLP